MTMFLTSDQPNRITQAWNTVARYPGYAGAQAAVDRLSKDGFPVEELSIVGSDLQLVEKVTGPMTRRKAAAGGAASGAWFGLLLGLLFGIFASGTGFLAAILLGLATGAAWGALFGLVAYSATEGRRDFTALQSISAAHYDVIATHGSVERASIMLGQAGLLPT
jgi:heat induced stress protein YflT